MTRRRSALLAAAIVLACAGARPSAQVFDPRLQFRVLPTAHFVIHFHQGEDQLARRLSVIAEDTWRALERPLGLTPPKQTQVVLLDQTELFNGYATPVPYNTVVLYAVTPAGSSADFDDWLRLVFTHEFTHVIHLDRSEGWARIARGIFGRAPYAFPNLFLPPWQVEGLATYEESAITGEGRLHAGEFRAIVAEAARQQRLEPLDRVNGGLIDWPAGSAAYAYGVGFHQYLADRFGVETLASLATATAGRVPYLAAPAFKQVYGEPLGDLWREYEASLIASVTTPPPADPGLTRLTHQGFDVNGPRFDRFTCTGCPASIVYSAANPHGFPALYRLGLDGGTPEPLTRRYLGSTAGIGRETIYFDQVEVRRNTGLYSDLYALSRAGGRVRQLTREARLQDPDLSPDGSTLVATQNHPGQRDLVLVRLQAARPEPNTTVITLAGEPCTQFDAPKWSPDGRSIAVERHRLGAMPEIVLVDAETNTIRLLAAAPHTRFVTPAWRPDGAAIVAAVAPGDEVFNLVEIPLKGSPRRQLTHLTGGATWPDVAPDGRTIVFVGYTTGGYDLFSLPYPPDTAATELSIAADLKVSIAADPNVRTTTPGDPPVVGADPRARPYHPLATLKPTSWTPIVENDADQIRVGAALNGVDVLGYHAYSAAATWLVSGPAGAPTPSAATPDWQVSYLYNRWRPSLYLAASEATSFFAGPASDTDTPAPATRRERQIESGVIFPIRHARVQHAAVLSIVRAVADYSLGETQFTRNRTPIRASWQTITAHVYDYSISRERGIAVGASTEVVRRSLGSSADATTSTADLRAYLPGFADHHVVALRLGGGRSSGDATVGRTFLLGGTSPGESTADLGSGAFALLRGFGSNTFAGSHAAIANAEYRWPLARPQRGYGTAPLFLRTVHAAVFVDAGNVWTRSTRIADVKSSAGAQLSADLVAGFFAPFTVTAGAAWGHDGSGAFADRVTAYFRVGKAF